MIQPGQTVAGYEILSKLSAGGMATLFLAQRKGASGFSKHVAVKVVHEHLAEDPTFVQMFVDEALLSSRIHHPNVVHIEELKQVDGQHLLVMEYVAGVPLSTVMRRLSRLERRLTPELACYIAIQVADGLHAAHELHTPDGRLEGVVHRDVSPQNVLFAWEGHVKLIDFGVAKARSRMQQTTGASMKGKLRYMAPEQARGQEVDRRTDVYALGIVLWEMLTMRRRFHGPNDFALLDQVRSPEPIPPSRVDAAIPPELDAVVLRAMAANPDDRYATAQDFRRALAACMPAALALDASHLSELVRAACGGDLEKAKARLPSSMHLPSVLQAGPGEEPEPLKTLTLSAAEALGYLEEVAGGGDSGAFTPSAGSRASQAGPLATPATAASIVQPARRPPWMIAAVAAVLVVAVVLGVGLALRPGDSSGVAVPLEPRAHPPSSPGAASPPAPAPTAAPRPGDAAVAQTTHEGPAADAGAVPAQNAPPTTMATAGHRHGAVGRGQRSGRSAMTGRSSRTGRPAMTGRSQMTGRSAMGMRQPSRMGGAVPLADDFGF